MSDGMSAGLASVSMGVLPTDAAMESRSFHVMNSCDFIASGLATLYVTIEPWLGVMSISMTTRPLRPLMLHRPVP